MVKERPRTLGELRASGYRTESVKDEMRRLEGRVTVSTTESVYCKSVSPVWKSQKPPPNDVASAILTTISGKFESPVNPGRLK